MDMKRIELEEMNIEMLEEIEEVTTPFDGTAFCC